MPHRPRPWLAWGLLLLLECCAAVTLALAARLAWQAGQAPWATATQSTTQAARALQYWTLLIYVHAAACAWFRRARTPHTAWYGLAGILYLGCGFVFSLALDALVALGPWQEDVRTLVWMAVLPAVAWISGLAGCGLMAAAFALDRDPALESPTPAPAPQASPPRCRAFLPLVSLSLLLALLAAGGVAWRSARLFYVWAFASGIERSADFGGAVLYANVYLMSACIVLGAALGIGLRAVRGKLPDGLWLAGLLAVLGGLQHVWLLGWPAIAGGALAMRAAGRRR